MIPERHYSRRPRKPSSVTGGIFLLLLALCSLLLPGCSMVSGKRRTDGSLVVTSWRLLWKSEAIEFSAGEGPRVSDPQQQCKTCGSQSRAPFTATLRVGKSRSDEESIKLAVEAAVKAAVKSVVPAPISHLPSPR